MGKKALIFVLLLGLLAAGCSSKSASAEVTPTAAGSSNTTNITGALNLVLGTKDRASKFSSYHLELNLDTPQLNYNNTAVINETSQISADVQGENIHFIQTDLDTRESEDDYLIGSTEYKVVEGEKVDTLGKTKLAWTMWPLQVVLPYSYAAYWATPTGTDTVDGRQADVYTFDSNNATAESKSDVQKAGLTSLASASGTVWIDRETGCMLKLEMTYTDSFTDSEDKAVGDGTGTVKLEITKVGQIQVTEP